MELISPEIIEIEYIIIAVQISPILVAVDLLQMSTSLYETTNVDSDWLLSF